MKQNCDSFKTILIDHYSFRLFCLGGLKMTSLLIELYDRHTIEKMSTKLLSVIVMRFYIFLQEKLLRKKSYP